MPCINMTTNLPLTKETESSLKAAFGKAIEIIPRKSENWLMCTFHGAEHLWFRGREDSAAYIEVKLFGSITEDVSASFTAEITRIAEEILAIPADRIYISYFTTPLWGWNGKNF